MLTVVHVISSASGGGAEFLARHLNIALPKTGFKSILIYLTNPSGRLLEENEHCLGFQSPRDPRVIVALRRIVRDLHKRDRIIVHAHLTHSLYFVPTATAGMPVSRVYTEHSTYNSRRSFPVLKPFERIVYGRYDRIVAISKGVETALQRWLEVDGSDRISVIHNGARMFTPHPLRPGRRLKLLSIGSLHQRKGFDLGLKAVAALPELIESYTILGEGPFRSELEAQIKQYGLGDKVVLAGWSDHLQPFLDQADVFLMPSRWEGFGLVAVEALSAGLPLVCSNVPGLQEIADGCGAAITFQADNVAATAKALALMADRVHNVAGLATLASERASKFTLDRMVDQHVNLYSELAQTDTLTRGWPKR